MEQEQALRAIVDKFYAAVDRKDIPAILEPLHPEISWWILGTQGNIVNGHYIGHEQVGTFFKRLNTVFSISYFQPREFYVSASSRVVTVMGKEEGVVNALGHNAKFDADWNGKPFHNRWVHIFWLDENLKVVKFRANFTQFDADYPYDGHR